VTRGVPVVVAVIVLAAPASAQDVVNVYFTASLNTSADAVAAARPGARDAGQIRNLLPLRNPNTFVDLVRARRLPTAAMLDALLGQVDAERLNKMLAASPGVAGTGLVSRVVAPAVFSAAVEYGSILQETQGTVTTLRGNLLGVSRLLLGGDQFPSCPKLTEASCPRGARILRSITLSASFDDKGTQRPATAAGAPSLISEEYRVSAWGARVDLTPSNQLDDPKYLIAWNDAVTVMAASPEAAQVTRSIADLFADPEGAVREVYLAWQERTVELLQDAPVETFRTVLAGRIAMLPGLIEAADPKFAESAAAVARAYANYDVLRSRLLTAAQTNKFSIEYTNRRPADQPDWSNLRLIYSHQPASAAAVVTLNAAASMYHATTDPASSRVRDVQLAGQIDRRLGDVGALGPAVLTLAGYYQWMKADALILLPAGTTAPGSGIELPDEASTLLGTRGHIGVFQAKVSITLSEAIKVPFSMTWATRKELVNEQDVRGQVGLTLDIDQLLH
jgi:hypothetical protein